MGWTTCSADGTRDIYLFSATDSLVYFADPLLDLRSSDLKIVSPICTELYHYGQTIRNLM